MKLFKPRKRYHRQFIMSVDVDGWSSLLRYYSIDHDANEANRQVCVEKGIDKLINLIDKHNIKATFFITGEMAINHPKKVKEIVQVGHEVACHGLYHDKNECLLDKLEQKKRIVKAMTILENITGIKPLGFRAPCLLANKTTLEVLSEMGFLYDSTFLPMIIPGQYGSFSFKFSPYQPIINNNNFIEIPVSSNPIIPFPLSGSWLRNLGPSWVKFGIRTLFNLGYPVMIYVHPRDIMSLPSINGVPSHVYRKTGDDCLKMVDKILGYVKQLGGRTSRAIDLATNFRVR